MPRLDKISTRTRQGRGKHGHQRGGARPNAGRPRSGREKLGVNLPGTLVEAAQTLAGVGQIRAGIYREILDGKRQRIQVVHDTLVPENLYLTEEQRQILEKTASERNCSLSAAADFLFRVDSST